MLWWVPAGLWAFLSGAYGYEAVTGRPNPGRWPSLRRTGSVDRRGSVAAAGVYAIVAILWIVSRLAV